MLKRKSLSSEPVKSMSMRNVALQASLGLGEQQAVDDLSI